jgi:preprotein translocase subunit SecG
MSTTVIAIAQIVISIVLIILVLLQERGTGLGGVFGGSTEFYQQRRGLEKIIFYSTIVLAAIFLALNLIALFRA